MNIKVRLRGRTKKVAAKEKVKVIEVLKRLKINPETVLVKRGKEIIMDEETLSNGDGIEIIKVVSGG